MLNTQHSDERRQNCAPGCSRFGQVEKQDAIRGTPGGVAASRLRARGSCVRTRVRIRTPPPTSDIKQTDRARPRAHRLSGYARTVRRCGKARACGRGLLGSQACSRRRSRVRNLLAVRCGGPDWKPHQDLVKTPLRSLSAAAPRLSGGCPESRGCAGNEEARTEQHRYRLLNNYSRVCRARSRRISPTRGRADDWRFASRLWRSVSALTPPGLKERVAVANPAEVATQIRFCAFADACRERASRV